MRQLTQFLAAALISLALLCPAQAKLARGGAVPQNGFLPAGHWIASPTGQALTQIFPQPDASTATTAREHWAYWDGTHDIPYDLAIGVSFGAYPYVCTLTAGPPGMVVEHSIYTSFQDPDYCRVLWHPQGNISSNWSGTVSVLVTDQQLNTITISWTLGTDDTTTHFVFVSTTGSGSTCSYSVPCTFATAFGSTFAATSFPGAICYVFGGSYSGTPGGSNSNLPYYTDTDTGVDGFEPYAARKPNALIGIPGQTVTLDATAADTAGYPHLIQVGTHAADWYMENVTANGYNTNAVDELFTQGTSARQTYDQVGWTNSGYGTGTSNNMSMFNSSGIQTPRQYLFITDSFETNRESGAVGNNYGFEDLYSYSYVLTQRSVENSPSASLDGLFYYKCDETNSETRENYANVAGASHGFDYGVPQYSGIANDESAYNLGVNVKSMWAATSPATFTWGNTAFYRNTLLAGSGTGTANGETAYNLEGPGNGATSGPISAASSTASGSLSAGTQYTWGITSTGVSGESATIIGGTNGDASTGVGGGSSNRVSLTISAGDSAATLSWLPEAGAITYNGYRELASCGGGTGCWTEYTNVTSPWTDIGAAGTTAVPPASPGTAVSAARFNYDSNVWATTNATPPPPTGATVVNDSGNIIDNPGGTIVCLATGIGCASVGALNTTYGSYGAIAGKTGYQIQ